jgi:hypothetical protein
VLRRAWAADYGSVSVIGLAPSAAAAGVLAGDLGIGAENTAKWAYEDAHGRWNLTADQLVIVDEASLAGTMFLDLLTGHAARWGRRCCWLATLSSSPPSMPEAHSGCWSATATTPMAMGHRSWPASGDSRTRGRRLPPWHCAEATLT